MTGFLTLDVLICLVVGFACALASHAVMPLEHRRRRMACLLLAGIALLVPFLLPAEAGVVRFLLGVFAALMAFKIHEVARWSVRGARLPWREHRRFVANVFRLSVSSPGVAHCGMKDALRAGLTALAWMAVSVVLLSILNRQSLIAPPFWLQHVIVAGSLLLFVIFELQLFVAVTRMFGARIIDANDRPWRAVTPADFWRRYNRIIGQFLHDNVFRPVNRASGPVQGVMAAFFVSGVLHEYVFWLAIGKGAGLQMLFFLLQGGAVALTAGLRPQGAARMLSRAGTWLFMLLSSVPFFISFHLMTPVYPAHPWLAWGGG